MNPQDLSVNPADDALLHLAAAVRAAGYRFVTVTPATHARVNARPGNAWARDLRDVFGWSRPFGPGLLPDPILDLMRQAEVLVEHEGGWRSAIRLSSLDGALFVHSAFPTIAADAVFFGPDTYRFASAIKAGLAPRRSGTAARTRPITRAVDIGCGAGPGGILVARAAPDAEVLMVDINDQALRYARINAALAGVGNAASIRSDLLSDVEGLFDVIVSNPPYLLDPAQRTYRHGGGELGAGLSLSILDAALERLAPHGTLVLYTGSVIVDGVDRFRQAASERLGGALAQWIYTEMDPDVFGEELESGPYGQADRIAAVVLTVTKQG